jgi:hypothetical protein
MTEKKDKAQTIPMASHKETVAVHTETREFLEILDPDEVLSAVTGGSDLKLC